MENNNYNDYIKYEPSDGKDSIFISYQSNSKDTIINFSNMFEQNGCKTWYAPRNIACGHEWSIDIKNAISNCKVLLLVFTHDADNSEQVYREITLADYYKKPVLWINLDKSRPDNLLYFLGAIQWYESSTYDDLIEILKKDNISEYLKSNRNKLKKEIIDEKEFNNFTKAIYAFETPEDAARCAARVYFEKAQIVKNNLFLLPTGRSGKRVFYEMIKIASEYKKPFGKNYIMNDTETIGVKTNDKTSRFNAIDENLLKVLDTLNKKPKDKYIIKFGMNNKLEPEEYAKEIIDDLDVSVYGISISPYMEIIGYCNGKHEKSEFGGPRIIEITKDTKEYIDNRQKVSSIYTVGMQTVYKSDILMILAFDDNAQENLEASKSVAINRLFRGEKTIDVPLTCLRDHNNAYVITTKEIASKAKILEYAITNISPEEAAKCIIKN